MRSSDDDDARGGLRVDKWLWFARFYKSRSQATEAVSGGLVHVNDERVKPSRALQPGDRLLITREADRFEVIVLSMPVRRGPASEARLCYDETPASVAARQARREYARLAAPSPDGRPDKHGRRALRDLRNKN